MGSLFPSPGDLPNPGIKPRSPALQADSLPAETVNDLCPWSPQGPEFSLTEKQPLILDSGSLPGLCSNGSSTDPINDYIAGDPYPTLNLVTGLLVTLSKPVTLSEPSVILVKLGQGQPHGHRVEAKGNPGYGTQRPITRPCGRPPGAAQTLVSAP